MVLGGKFIAVLIAAVLALGGGFAWVANQRSQDRAVEETAAPQPPADRGETTAAPVATPESPTAETPADAPAEQDMAAAGTAEPEQAPAPATPAPAAPEETPEETPAETRAETMPATQPDARDAADDEQAGGSQADDAQAEGGEPEFDVVRVDDDGNVVVAGRAAPGSNVDIVVGDRVVATIETDGRGEFAAVLDDPLAVGTSALRLRATGPDGTATDSGQEVAVFIEEAGAAPLVVAQQAEGPTEVLQEAAPVVDSAPDAPPSEAAAPDPAAAEGAAAQAPAAAPEPVAPKGEDAAPVLIRTVDVRPPQGSAAENEVVVAGSAPAGVPIRLYLQDRQVGETLSSETGDWIIGFTQEMSPGRYVVRADQIDPDSGNVVSRAQTRFRRAAIVAEGTPAPQPAPQQQVAQAEGADTAPVAGAPATAQSDVTAQADATAQAGAATGEQAAAPDAAGQAAQLRGAPASDKDVDISVVRGDSLWRISRNAYGRGIHYTVIFDANRSQITDPNLIFPGQIFTIPEFREDDAG